MKKFHKKIDYRSRKAMVGFLKNHFRYDTMSSWNRASSYANNMKIRSLGLNSEQASRLYDIMDCDGAYETINELTDEFDRENDYAWQAHFNGRSGGYLVLYSGGLKDTGYKSFCTSCGQRNFRTVEESGCTCGRYRKDTRVNYKHPLMQKYASGRSVDENEDFEEWSIEELRERCRIVERFDILCDSIAEEAARLSESVETVEETVYVPTKRKVLKEVAVC